MTISSPPFVRKCLNKIKSIVNFVLPDFVAVHYLCFYMLIGLSSILMYPVKNHKYVDILFFAVSSGTQSGLNTIDVNKLTLYQQIILYIECCAGSIIFTNILICFIRLYWFETHFENIKQTSKLNFEMRRTQSIISRIKTNDLIHNRNPNEIIKSIDFLNKHQVDDEAKDKETLSNNILEQSIQFDIKPPPSRFNRQTQNQDVNFNQKDNEILPLQREATYLSFKPQVGRNSNFINLSKQQKDELGGVEYRALRLLAVILLFYYFGFHIIGAIMHLIWILATKSYNDVLRNDAITKAWWAFFTPMSAFSNLGYTLTPENMVPFNYSRYVLLVEVVLILGGNTLFPVFLRFIIWVLHYFAKDLSQFKESLEFLLDHPRRCFTLLFPNAPTWWLLLVSILFNSIDLILFIVLDLKAQVVTSLPKAVRVLDGFYQAVNTRTSGFACINLASLNPAIQVSYTIMMYVSVLPLAISIRRTNVYEEQSLAIYVEDDDIHHENTVSYIGAHLRKQLSYDLWFLSLALFIICIAESDKIQNDPNFTIFKIIFELVSSYGTVGLSLGYPNINASFVAKFNTVSKLVVMATMIRGRHRGLPYSIDRAIVLPSNLEEKDKLQESGSLIEKDPVLTFFESLMPESLRLKFFNRTTHNNDNETHNNRYTSETDEEDPVELAAL